MNSFKAMKNAMLFKGLEKPSQNIEQTSVLSQEDISLQVSEVKALILRFLNYTGPVVNQNTDSTDYVGNLISSFIDEDLASGILNQGNVIEQKEIHEIISEIKTKLGQLEIFDSYAQYKKDIFSYYRKLLKLMRYYSSGKITSYRNNKKEEINLNDLQKIH